MSRPCQGDRPAGSDPNGRRRVEPVPFISPGACSAWQLKPSIPGLAGQIENEMFCVRLAPRLDLPAPRCWTERFGDISVVVIERYDRQRITGRRTLPIDKPGGEVRRVHQEDCCQALKVDPRNKYQRDGGPGIRAIMELLSGSGRPSDDRDRFIRACAYNFVIGGTDAHAKNYGLLLSAGGRFRLAPLYDIVSWLPYSRNKREDKLAMSVDGLYEFDRILPRHWEAEAKRSGYDSPAPSPMFVIFWPGCRKKPGRSLLPASRRARWYHTAPRMSKSA